uniref:Uncharacterized protein n=1 Tax=Anguilla anguilla TaxID=7936 RepID=A0A0E9T3X3_ANGAN
MVSCRRPRS